MKITVKTTQQKVFSVDVEGSDTVAVLKGKIEEDHGHPVSSQKIIYAGKILTDDKTIDSCGIKEKDFLVLMVSKPKPTPAATSSATPAAAPAAAAAPPPEPAPAVAPPTPAAAPNPEPAAPATSASGFGNMSSFLSGEALQTTIANMTEMGFPRDQVLRALRASFNNPDRAVEYLMTGIPAHLEAEASGPAAQGLTQPAQATSTPATVPAPASVPEGQPQNLFQLAQQQQQSGGGAGANAPIANVGGQQLDIGALRNHPQIAQLREQLANNPENIQALIQQLAQANPRIAQAIAQNPELLLQLLDIPAEEGDDGQLPPGVQAISVTPEERDAIARLEALGFPRQAVIEAYLACDRNEELAANMLFDGAFDDYVS